MDLEILAKQEKQPTRLKYNTPTLEEYGDLHKLTHGGSGIQTDLASGNQAYLNGVG